MYDVYAELATDDKLEVDGVWHPMGDGRVLVARDGNKKYSRVLGRLVEKHQQDLEVKSDASDKLSDEIMIEAMAEGIFIQFEKLGFKGQPLDATIESRKVLLGVKDFRARISKLSKDFESYRVKQEAAAGKP